MQLHVIPVEEISVPENRQRKVFDETQIQQLAASIADNGLIHPIVIRRENGEVILVAGERRLRALDICWGFGQEVRCGTRVIPERAVPCLFLGEIDEIQAFEVELEENVRRTDLDWKDKAVATARLFEYKQRVAERDGVAGPTPASLAIEVSGTSEGAYQTTIAQDLILARNLDNPVVAKAPSKKEAIKALKRSEESERNAAIARAIGTTFTASLHSLRQGDCLSVMAELPEASFDVLLTDPPYGIDAQDFGDSGGKTAGAHFYDDSPESWNKLMGDWVPAVSRLMKENSHAYVFCDIQNFLLLSLYFRESGWKVFRTPLIWVNPTAMRAPWPDQGPQRKWQAILYAVRGDKRVTQLASDVLTYSSDVNLGHQAQKPVGLYLDLLKRSGIAGEAALDTFAGTGPLFPAAHQLKIKATGIEADPAAFGIASTRLRNLK